MARPVTITKAPPQIPRGKLWLFRFGAAVGLPAALFALIELTLRITGTGHPTSFLLPEKINGTNALISNPRFGWRFFGPQQARTPQPLAFTRAKTPGTIRIFVFGESAAFGDPQPEFGLPRMLQALLSERFPQTRFEVINAAMTAINSHVVLPIARDCARADGDLWVVYMGNNEVVGSFGAGTVFGSQTPPLAFIRMSLALKQTRTGQLLDDLVRRFNQPAADKTEWGGMLMFMENQVRADDARLAKMYSHFEQNLRGIIAAGRRAGVGMVVSTVAVNLKDCAPFASTGLATLNPEAQARWKDLFQRGTQAQQEQQFQTAAELFAQASQINPDGAELEFRRGQVALAGGAPERAREHFRNARDRDTLRFRCDSQLNEITRRVAADRAAERIAFADAEKELARQSPHGLPGAELFYEHVHLTFAGNYWLARTIAESIVPLLPEPVRIKSTAGWADAGRCAARLGWSDWAQQAALTEIAGRLNDPPFTQQSDHSNQMERLNRQMRELMNSPATTLINRAETQCIEALKMSPDDPVLLAQLAGLLEANGKLVEAEKMARRTTEILPNSVANWSQLGMIFARQNRLAEAETAFQQALIREPENVFTRHSRAQVLVRLNRTAEAQRELEQVVALKPAYGTAHLGLGKLLEAAGQKAAAEQHFEAARKHRVNRPGDLAVLARFCQAQGWLTDAATNFSLAVKLNPTDGILQLEAGRCAAALNRYDEARDYFGNATQLLPDSGEAHFLYARELGRRSDSAGAAQHFATATRLLPEVVEARVNLGVALMNLGMNAEARREFEEVLRRQPGNSLAQQNLTRLKAISP